ncbi:MAG: hypothetical protein HY273_07625 [Gammaproteobacteria bacterium]|nr:hypothetical protein [Gammaproteobacteria bacterium]
MNFDVPTDAELDHLRQLPKLVANPRCQWKNKPGHRQKNFLAEGGKYQFEIYLRQNTNDERDFSCGLKIIKPDGTALTLCRYNGGGHAHHDIQYRPHIHIATAAAISLGRKPETHADETNRYEKLDGALHCLVSDCMVNGLPTQPDERDMFGAN